MFISDAEGPVRSPTFQFADFRLDCSRFELLRNGRALRVERKPMELLILLASREGELVTRAEIAQRLWSSEVLSTPSTASTPLFVSSGTFCVTTPKIPGSSKP